MQRWRRRRRDETSMGTGLALLGMGLIAGVAIGALVADRLGGVGGISARVRGRLRGRRRDPAGSEAGGAFADDEYVGDREEYESDEGVAVAPPTGAPSTAEGVSGSEQTGDEGEDMADDDLEPFASADPALEDRVLTAFTNDPVLCERAIDIGAIGERTIELTGVVDTDEEYEHATVVTRGVPGVETVVNRLTVRDDEAAETRAARRYAEADPRFVEARWENERVGTGRTRQGTSQDVGRHAGPKVPLESRSQDEAEAVRDAADDIPLAPAPRRPGERPPRADHQPPEGEAEAR